MTLSGQETTTFAKSFIIQWRLDPRLCCSRFGIGNIPSRVNAENSGPQELHTTTFHFTNIPSACTPDTNDGARTVQRMSRAIQHPPCTHELQSNMKSRLDAEQEQKVALGHGGIHSPALANTDHS